MVQLPPLESRRGTGNTHHRGVISSLPTTAHSLSTLDCLKKVSRTSLDALVSQDKRHRLTLSTRDVSHVKDKPRSPRALRNSLYEIPPATQYLPTSLAQLEKVVAVSSSLGVPRTEVPNAAPLIHPCEKAQCIDAVMRQREKLSQTFAQAKPKKTQVRDDADVHPFVTMIETRAFRPVDSATVHESDFSYLGHPTGRQDCENLRDWFHHMQQRFLGDCLHLSFLDSLPKLQTGMVVYKACVKELTRQVSVLCVERGKVLQEVMSFYSDVWAKILAQAECEMKQTQRAWMAECEALRQAARNSANDYELRIAELKKTLGDARSDLEEKVEECFRLKKRLQHIHENEQKMLMRLMQHQDSLAEPEPKLGIKLSFTVAHVPEDKSNPTSPQAAIVPTPVTSPNILDEFIQDKAVGDHYLWELVAAEQQTDAAESALDKETQTEETIANDTKPVLEESKKAIGETTADATALSFNPGQVAQVHSGNPLLPIILDEGRRYQEESQPLEGGTVSEDQSIAGGSQFIESDVLPNRDTEVAGKSMSEDSFHEPQSNPDFDSFLPNISNIESEGIDAPLKKYELIARQLDEKEHLLQKIKMTIEERKKTLSALDSALEEKKQMYQDIASELEAAETQYQSLAKEKLELEKKAKPRAINFQRLVGIEEVPETDETYMSEFIPEGADVESWKAGYSLGLEKGWTEGIHAGEDLGYERAISDAREELDKSSAPTTPSGTPSHRISKSRVKRRAESSDSEDESVQDAETPGGVSRSNSKISQAKAELEESSDSSSDTDSRILTAKGPRQRRNSMLKTKKRGAKAITKFEEFTFQHGDLGKMWRKRTHPAPRLLAHFLRKPMEVITKSAVMSHKMLLKFYSQIYDSAADSMKDAGDLLLIEIAYDEIDKKFVLKKVVEKKMMELIASSLNAVEMRRVAMFIKLIGAGTKVGLTSYSKHSVRMYISAYSFMMNSKVGIMVGIDETAEVQLFPMSRAVECLKDRLSAFDRLSALPQLQAALERQSRVDHKRVNKAGLVELELVLEILLQEFEARQQQVREHLTFLIKAFAQEEQFVGITPELLVMVVRHISPEKLSCIITVEDGIETYSPELEKSLVKSEHSSVIPPDKLFDLCIEHSLFRQTDMDSFFGSNWRSDDFQIFPGEIAALIELSSNVVPRLSVIQWAKVEPVEVWTQRIATVQVRADDQPALTRAALRLLTAELTRLSA